MRDCTTLERVRRIPKFVAFLEKSVLEHQCVLSVVGIREKYLKVFFKVEQYTSCLMTLFH